MKPNAIPFVEIRSEFLRFLIVGGVQTVLSYLFFLLLIQWLAYPVAYSLTYCAGIVLSYFLHVLFVFKERVRLPTFLKFPLVYLVQYLAGLVLLWLFVDLLHITPAWAMVAVIALTIPVTFLASRLVIKNKPC